MTSRRYPFARAASHFVSALAILCAGAALLLCPCPAATVTGSILDVTENPYGGVVNSLQFTPLSCPQAVGTNTVWPVAATARLTNGIFSVNLVGGLYWAGLIGDNQSGSVPKTVKILVPPNDTNVWQINDCANLATNLGTFVWTNSPRMVVATNINNASGTNVMLAGSFTGDGSGLTNLPANTNALSPADTLRLALALTNATAFDTNGAAAQVQSKAGTNVFWRTNIWWTIDTNHLSVTGADYAPVNSTFTRMGHYFGRGESFTNSSGIMLWKNDIYNYVFSSLNPDTNSYTDYYYNGDADVFSMWGAPYYIGLFTGVVYPTPPTVSYARTWNTNIFAVISSGLITNRNVYLDSNAGNDATGVIGLPSYPFATPFVAAQFATGSNAWIFSPGIYNLSPTPGSYWLFTNSVIIANGATIKMDSVWQPWLRPYGTCEIYGGTWNTSQTNSTQPIIEIGEVTNYITIRDADFVSVWGALQGQFVDTNKVVVTLVSDKFTGCSYNVELAGNASNLVCYIEGCTITPFTITNISLGDINSGIEKGIHIHDGVVFAAGNTIKMQVTSNPTQNGVNGTPTAFSAYQNSSIYCTANLIDLTECGTNTVFRYSTIGASTGHIYVQNEYCPTNLIAGTNVVFLLQNTNFSGTFAGTFTGNGAGLTFTNATGAKFRLGVNASTNGLIFIPQ